MRDGVEEHELFDAVREGEQDRGHDVREVLRQGLDVGGCVGGDACGAEIIFRGFDQVGDFEIDELEDAFFRCFLVVAEGVRRVEADEAVGVGRGGGGAAGGDE